MINIVLNVMDGQIMLYSKIETRDDCVTVIDLIRENLCQKAHATNKKPGIPNIFPKRKVINKVDFEHGHVSKEIAQSMKAAMGLKSMNTFEAFEDCALTKGLCKLMYY